MRKLLGILFLFLIHTSVFAQKTLPAFGKIDAADLQMKSCGFEPDAPAMKLFDEQEITFETFSNGSYKLITERRVRIKIFNQEGYEYASIKLPYFNKRRSTKIKDLSGVVYSLDSAGKIITHKLEKKDFFKDKAEENISVINFTFSNIKPGSVVEYRYRKIESNIDQIDPWIIQDEIPTLYASTLIKTPGFVKIREKAYGTDSLPKTVEKTGGNNNYFYRRFYHKDSVKSFKPEPFMSSYKDNLVKVVFMMYPDDFASSIILSGDNLWSFAGSMLLESPSFGKQIDIKIPETEAIIDSAKKIESIDERIAFIYSTLKNRIGDAEEQTLYANDIVEAWKEKTASSAEINLILLNLLRKAGVKSHPLLVSTKDHGFIASDFPSLSQFNGVDVIAIVDSNTVYTIDASIKHQTYKIPPLNVLNRKGYLLDKNNMRWVVIDDDRPLSTINMVINGTLDSNGIIKGEVVIKSLNYAKVEALDSTDIDEKKDEYTKKKQTGLNILSHKRENEKNLLEPLVDKLQFSYELENTDNFYFVNPQFFSTLQKNPFVEKERNTSIDFGCSQAVALQFYLKIPKDYSIEHLPKSVLLRSSDTSMSYTRSIFQDPTTILYKQNFQIKRAIYDKEEYSGLQEFFGKMFGLMTETIGLKKNK